MCQRSGEHLEPEFGGTDFGCEAAKPQDARIHGKKVYDCGWFEGKLYGKIRSSLWQFTIWPTTMCWIDSKIRTTSSTHGTCSIVLLHYQRMNLPVKSPFLVVRSHKVHLFVLHGNLHLASGSAGSPRAPTLSPWETMAGMHKSRCRPVEIQILGPQFVGNKCIIASM